MSTVALSFVARGIPFDWFPTNRPGRPAFLLSTSAISFGLGFRAPDFQPTYIDYKGYKDERKKLLSDGTILREALKLGGIIWRLVVGTYREEHGEIIDFEEIFVGQLEHACLNEQDLGIIVGLYNIWSRRCSIQLLLLLGDDRNVKETTGVPTHSSWWPQPHTWGSSDANVIYWSRGMKNGSKPARMESREVNSAAGMQQPGGTSRNFKIAQKN